MMVLIDRYVARQEVPPAATPPVVACYGPFDTKEDATKFAALLDWVYGEPEVEFVEYTDEDLVEKDWAVVNITAPDWEQFRK